MSKSSSTTDADSSGPESLRTREEVQRLIEEYEPNLELQKEHRLSLDGLSFLILISDGATKRIFLGFQNLLLSDEFSVMKPWCAQDVYQDMDR